MKPSFEIVLANPVSVGTSIWSGRLKIVDASHRGLPPHEFSKMANTIFAGADVYRDLRRMAS